jgi:hypothetical protein
MIKVKHSKKGFAAAISWIDKNKSIVAKISYVTLFLVYLIVIPAWPIISKVFLIEKDFGQTLLVGVFIIHLGIILSILIEIYDKEQPHETWFQNHQEALPSIKEALNIALKERPCKITWIGISFQSAWLALENVFNSIEMGEATEIKMLLLLIDSDYIRHIDGENNGLASVTEGQLQYMLGRCKAMNQKLRATNSEIVLAQYSYMPNFHGPKIGEHTLFLSTVRWEGDGYGNLSVPLEPNELYTQSSDKGKYIFKLYNSWVEKALESARKNEKMYMFPVE